MRDTDRTDIIGVNFMHCPICDSHLLSITGAEIRQDGDARQKYSINLEQRPQYRNKRAIHGGNADRCKDSFNMLRLPRETPC